MQTVQFEKFEGPLDLLLNLLSTNEIDIYDIPIAEITHQYMQYIYAAQELDIDLAADFIVVAAQLIEIKSKMMLPPETNDEDDEQLDPRAELVARLLEYKVFKQISSWVKQFEDGYNETVSKDAEYFPQLKDDYSDISLSMEILTGAMRSVFAKHQIRISEDILADYNVTREEFSTEEMMLRLSDMLEKREEISFFSLFEEEHSRSYIIAAFLAILEMLKMDIIRLEQGKNYTDITIRKHKK